MEFPATESSEEDSSRNEEPITRDIVRRDVKEQNTARGSSNTENENQMTQQSADTDSENQATQQSSPTDSENQVTLQPSHTDVENQVTRQSSHTDSVNQVTQQSLHTENEEHASRTTSSNTEPEQVTTEEELPQSTQPQQQNTTVVVAPLPHGHDTRLPSYADVSGNVGARSATNRSVQCNRSQSDVNNYAVNRNQQQHSVDDIGVMLEYTPPDEGSYNNNSTPSSGQSSRRRRRRRRSRRSRTRRTGAMTYFRTLTNSSWFGQCLSGLFTAIMFLAIGIVFLVYFHHLPTYIGVLFILVSLPPFCMAINR